MMEKQGLIEITLIPGSRKNKQVCFTSEGKTLAEKVVLPLMQAEQDTFTALSEKERKMLLSVMQKYITILRANSNKIMKTSSEDVE